MDKSILILVLTGFTELIYHVLESSNVSLFIIWTSQMGSNISCFQRPSVCLPVCSSVAYIPMSQEREGLEGCHWAYSCPRPRVSSRVVSMSKGDRSRSQTLKPKPKIGHNRRMGGCDDFQTRRQGRKVMILRNMIWTVCVSVCLTKGGIVLKKTLHTNNQVLSALYPSHWSFLLPNSVAKFVWRHLQ